VVYTRNELSAAFAAFEETLARAAESHDWDPWLEHYTEDIEYIEHAMGTMHGREAIRAWIWETMTAFPGNVMTSFPTTWSVIDEARDRIICEIDNPLKDPGDGTIIGETNISILTYAGDGKWCRQEDIYNPLRFVRAGQKWCKKAAQLGTLPDDAAEWMQRYQWVREH
jgi:ketosteroid isomerase-like protein